MNDLTDTPGAGFKLGHRTTPTTADAPSALTAFNTAAHPDAVRVAATWANVPRWAYALADGRPFSTVEEIAKFAELAASTWDAADLTAALTEHPRIGERASLSNASAALSKTEQAGMNTASTAVTAAIAKGNRAYEKRFGRVFLIRAAGRTAEVILSHLTRRLEHDPDVEVGESLEQLKVITALRIRRHFADGDPA